MIEDALDAMELSSAAPEGRPRRRTTFKGECDQRLSETLGGLHGSEELAVHLFDLVRNTLEKSDPDSVRNLVKWSAPH